MKTILGALLAVAAMYVAYLAGTGRALPFGLQSGAALWLVLGLGMAGCALGPLSTVASSGNWMSPWAILGILAGVAALAVAVAFATGTTLGIVSDARQWMFVLAAVIGVKVVVAAAQTVLAVAPAVAGRG